MKKIINSDEQAQQSSHLRAIQWVGINQVESYVKSTIQSDSFFLPAEIDLTVNLKSGFRGVHMSRLYALLNDQVKGHAVSFEQLDQLLLKAIESQDGISSAAQAHLRFEWPISTLALKSKTAGFRKYPVRLTVKKKSVDHSSMLTVEMRIIYSSTCPQSSKLAKEYFKDQIHNHTELIDWFESDRIFLATPHAQRSEIKVELQIEKSVPLDFEKWVTEIETVLGTPVQTSVKKSDEMEFARLNAENPMFCEDAIRKVANFLDTKNIFSGYQLTVKHLESLHPHNAYSQTSFNFQE
jgi:GTP cyclohydrolase IB